MLNGGSSVVGSAPVTSRLGRPALSASHRGSRRAGFAARRPSSCCGCRAMAPVELPDPSMHTIYIVDPSQMFTRYAAAFAPTARMREGAQAGFFVLARLAYLGFGAVPGFFVDPLCLRPHRGRAGLPARCAASMGSRPGVIAIIVLLSCPVDLDRLGHRLPRQRGRLLCRRRRRLPGHAEHGRGGARRGWSPRARLLTLGGWSHGMGVVLAVTTVVVYGLVRLGRDRRQLLGDGRCWPRWPSGSRVVPHGRLAPCARPVRLHPADACAAEAFLDHPAQLRQWHSANWRWAPYVAYLLVPAVCRSSPSPSASARRLRNVPTPQLFVGLACAGQFAVFSYLQFDYHVQDLEMHFFSSTLWGGGLSRARDRHRRAQPRPVAAHRSLAGSRRCCSSPSHSPTRPTRTCPPSDGGPPGPRLAPCPSCSRRAHAAFRPGDDSHARPSDRLGARRGVCRSSPCRARCSCSLWRRARRCPASGGWRSAGDPSPAYAGALGGSAATLVDWYQVSADLPSFVGDPTYKGEQLLMWFPWNQPLLGAGRYLPRGLRRPRARLPGPYCLGREQARAQTPSRAAPHEPHRSRLPSRV